MEDEARRKTVSQMCSVAIDEILQRLGPDYQAIFIVGNTKTSVTNVTTSFESRPLAFIVLSQAAQAYCEPSTPPEQLLGKVN